MNWFKKIKLASTKYLYHGTGIQNIPTILSQGLNVDAEKLYNQDIEHGSIRTYGGAYLTNNIMTAISSARKSSRLLGSEKVGLVVVKIEDTTPHIVLDEDNFPSPGFALQEVYPYSIFNPNSSPENLAYFITNKLPDLIDSITNKYLESIKSRHYDNNFSRRVFNSLAPYAKKTIETFCYSLLASQINNYFQGSSEYMKKYFEEKFPQFAGIDESKMTGEYRASHDLLIQKAHRLTTDMDSYFSANVRSLENISYRGKNKIVMVCSLINNDFRNKYYTELDILYSSDNSFLGTVISDIQERLGENLIVRYKDQVLYNKPKEEKEYELV
jgi:hypothetical protein